MNETAKISQLIINSPYSEPVYHWEYNRESKSFYKVSGRRSAGYLVASKGAKKFDDDSGQFIEIALVNQIRPHVKEWRESNYPGANNITRKLLNHWHDMSARSYPFFFCQLDAIETLIWLKESQEGRRQLIQDDGSKFQRICTKLCTGGGKTIVMAMLIAWQVCNKVRDSRNINYSRNILVVAPNLTVKKRLQVLRFDYHDNYYERFDILPVEIRELMSQAKIIIHNWQALSWDDDEAIAKRKEVDKRGPLSDGAYSRKILGSPAENWLVINDEAHHAYRLADKRREFKEEDNEATIWIQGLDRIHKARKILTCYDFSATPFIPGSKTSEENLFSWIVSDFSLSDGIESGLVKTPRVVVRDNLEPDPETYKSKLYHIYSDEEVKNNLTSSQPQESLLPDLVRSAYKTLASDWLEVFKQWRDSGKKIPPVMISVANCTRTAERIERLFLSQDLLLPEELCEPDKILRIDSRKLEDVTSSEGELLREKVDTVGQENKPGENLRNIISVGMLSEGWDARTVTHIMGLRAFTSQLLCEQVIGRGLRRTSYDKLNEGEFFTPEYVNVFGVPFSFLPHEDSGGGSVSHTDSTEIKALDSRREFAITWPNIIKLEYISGQKLSLDLGSINNLELDAAKTIIHAEIAPVLNGKVDLTRVSEIDLEKAAKSFRLQRIIYQTAAQFFDELPADWKNKGAKILLLGQVINLVREYLRSDLIKIKPELFAINESRKKIIFAGNMDRIIKNLWDSIRSENTGKIIPVYDRLKRTCSTGDMPRWWTIKPNSITRKSHINNCVYDSTWEASESYSLERNSHVKAWAKNDHLGFYIYYLYNGAVRKYLPDFLIRLDNDTNLILEVKGRDSEQDKFKRRALMDWVTAVNDSKEFGQWACDVSYNIADIDGIIEKYL
ncbi:MAG: DEAD/DEAH box helicase family protein [Synergistaceae bacterium]|nr:DEAD/DEAH box helicase family protein [Synergistaceae bacterium]